MKVLLVVGARPNYMKVAPLYHSMLKFPSQFDPYIVHTGQHYDANMSDVFFANLGLPHPHMFLGVGSGTHAEQTAKAMVAFEKVCVENSPSWVVVVGDVNSTLAASLVASKLGIRLAHVEAGLRSLDRSMAEEINRIVTDALSNLLLTPSLDANENLKREGIEGNRVVFVGNIMIDALEMMRDKIMMSPALLTFNLKPKEYFVLTVHRHSNLNNPDFVAGLLRAIIDLAGTVHCVFPVHPHTKKRFQEIGIWDDLVNIRGATITEPLGYIDFMRLVFDAGFTVTDSGGIQEETTYMGIPCVTLRPNTERPITITHGTNELCTVADLRRKAEIILSGNWKRGTKPPLWDGNTAARTLEALLAYDGR